MADVIKKKKDVIRSTKPEIRYKSQANSLSKIKTKYKTVKTKEDTYQDALNRNVLKLQAANADPGEIFQNTQAAKPSENILFKGFDYLTRPGRGIVALLTAGLAGKDIKNELGVKDPFDAFGQIMTRGNLTGLRARDEEFTGANLLQSLGGKKASTQDWNNFLKIAASLAVEIPLDPWTYGMTPALRAMKAGVKAGAQGVKAGAKAVGIKSKYGRKLAKVTKELKRDGIKLTEAGIEAKLSAEYGTIRSANSLVKTFGNAIGSSGYSNKRANKDYSIVKNIVGGKQKALIKDYDKLSKGVINPFNRVLKGKNDSNGLALIEDMKRVNAWPRSLDIADVANSPKLKQSIFVKYFNHLYDVLQGEQLNVTLNEVIQGALKTNLDTMPGGYSRLAPSVKEGAQASLYPDSFKIAGDRQQMDNILQGLSETGILPADKTQWDKYLTLRNISEPNSPEIYELLSSNLYQQRFDDISKTALEKFLQDKRGVRKFTRQIQNKTDLANFASNYYKDIQDFTEIAVYYKANNYLKAFIQGKKGITTAGWAVIKKDLERFSPQLAKEADDIIRGQIDIFKKRAIANLDKRTASRTKLSKFELTKESKNKLEGLIKELEKATPNIKSGQKTAKELGEKVDVYQPGSSAKKTLEDLFTDLGELAPTVKAARKVDNWLKKYVRGDGGITLKKWNTLKDEIIGLDPVVVGQIDEVIKSELKKFRKMRTINKTKLTKNELTKQGKDELERLFDRFDTNMLEGQKDAQKALIGRLDKIYPIGSSVKASTNPYIQKLYSRQHRMNQRGLELLKAIPGINDDVISDLTYRKSITGEILKDAQGNPVLSDYVAGVASQKNALNSQLTQVLNKAERSGSAFTNKVTGVSGSGFEANWVGRRSDINKALSIREAKRYIDKGFVDPKLSPADQMKAALKINEDWDAFITNPLASSAKRFNTIQEIYGFMPMVRTAFKEGGITTSRNLTTQQRLSGDFIPLSEAPSRRILAKTDETLALKVSQGKDITGEEMNKLIQEKFADFIPEDLKGTNMNEIAGDLVIDRHLDQMFVTSAPSQDETRQLVRTFDALLGVVKKTMLLTTGFVLRVFSGDMIHGLIAGVPLGQMLKGWTSGMMDLANIRKLDRKIDDIFEAMSSSADESVKALTIGDDFNKIDDYIRTQLTPEEISWLEMKELYEGRGIINAGQFSDDKHLGGAMSSQDYTLLAKRLMIKNGRRFSDPTAFRAIKSSLNATNNGINKFISFGHVSSEASRISVYKYLNKNATFGKNTKNWQRLKFKDIDDGLDFALYGNRRLSGFESKWMTRMFPFYRFWRFALEQNIRSVARLNLKPYYNIQRFFDTFKRAQNIENEDLSNYAIQQNYLPIRLEDDKISVLKVGYTPSTLLNITNNPQSNAFNEVIGQVNPIIKAILESATGTNSYTGMEYDNLWETWASNLVPAYNRVKSIQRLNAKYEKYPDRKRNPILDNLTSMFQTTWEGEASFNRLYEANDGLKDMISKIVRDGGYVPDMNDLIQTYIARVIKKKKYN